MSLGCALLLVAKVSFVQAEILTHSNGTTSHGKIAGFSENGVQFRGDKYYVFNLDKISSASVDEGVSGAEAKRQKAAIDRLNRLISEEYYKKRALSIKLRELLSNESYNELDVTANKMRQSKARWQSGDWLIEQFHYAFYSDLSRRDISGLSKRIEQIRQWAAERPKSSAAKVSLMSALKELATAYRGGGVASTVSAKNFARYKSINNEIMAIARSLINEKNDTGMMYSYLIYAMNSLGAKSQSIEKVALAAVRKEPGLGRPLENAVNALKPQWGGSYQQPTALLDKAYSLFPAPQNEYYYHIIVEFLELLNEHEYPKYGFDWARIQDGFESYRKRVLALDRDFHRMAKLAAMHGEMAAAKKYIDLTDGEWNHFAIEIWKSPHVLTNFEYWVNQKPDPIFAQIVQAVLFNKTKTVRKLVLRYLGVRSDLNRTDVYGNTLLHLAINNGQLDLVERLIKAGARVDRPDGSGRNPVHLAANKKQIDFLKLLIEAGADASALTGRLAQSALHLSAINGYRGVSKFLMDISPESISLSDRNGLTPLHLAASYGHEGLIEDFLSRKEVPLQSADREGNTALMSAIRQNHLGVVERLVVGGADINKKNQRHHTPLSYARELGFNDIAIYLEEAGGVETQGAVTDADITEAKGLVEQAIKYRKKEDAPKAVELLEKAIALNPGDFGIYHTLALLHWQVARDPESAAPVIQKSLELNPNYAESYYIAGRIFHELKRPDFYKPLFQQYVRMAPNTYNAKDLKRNYSSFLK